ncbi:pyroglutamyl-peptidase I [Kitasatospora sp. LaBMicrA B282]|uniref:pyroglutamyl-peptidase I n=1 Tax=Kitasatospora sp. LaBMicrA B282 TaxID=3420949 RepID=UPI003D0A7788
MTRVLLTGFEPFDGATANASWEAVRLVADAPPPGLAVTAVRLSCVFGLAAEQLRAAIAELDPALVLCVGVADGRPDLTVERIAVNLDDARIPDNAGRQPIDRPIEPTGPAAYFTTLPVKACVAAVRAAGLPASVSHTAGTFVCNHVFYRLMHLIATERPAVRGGFVHLPALPEQVLAAARPCLPAATAASGLRALLTAATFHRADLPLVGGALH